VDSSVLGNILMCNGGNCLEQDAFVALISIGIFLGQFSHERKSNIIESEMVEKALDSISNAESINVFENRRDRSKLARAKRLIELYTFLGVISAPFYLAGFLFLMANFLTIFVGAQCYNFEKAILLTTSFIVSFFGFVIAGLFYLLWLINKKEVQLHSSLIIFEANSLGRIKFNLLIRIDQFVQKAIELLKVKRLK
jgi:hypothetical protein